MLRSVLPGRALGSLLAAALLVAGAAEAQTAKVAASPRTYTPPRTPWGDPDLQGIWPSTEMIGVPMQRDPKFGTRNVVTEEEFEKRQARAKSQAESDSQEFVKKDAPVGINPPSYWIERGKPSRQASLIVDPPDGRMPPYTPEARKGNEERAAARKGHENDSWLGQSWYDRCVTRGLLGSILPVIYNNGNQILQAPGEVVIRYEMIHETRVIPLDGRPHAGSGVRTYMGDPRGRWEGNTLVVDTTNFVPGQTGVGLNGNGTPTSDALHVVERFERTGPDTIQYTAIIDDPKTWTRPWTISFPLQRDPHYQLYEYACHEANYAMIDILTGARKEERSGEGSK